MSHFHRTPKQIPIGFFNTTNEPDEVVAEYEIKAGTQDAAILAFYKEHEGASFSPTQVMDSLIGSGEIDKQTPLTSIRRGISNLAKAGLLAKCNHKVQGNYGRLESTWRLAK